MSNQRIHVIACGVLAIDIKRIADEMGLAVETTWLPGGLHNNPKELRRRLQETIDEVSGSGATRIAVGYGVCGRGTVGIHARHVPLVIPRVHDCIGLFLGSDAAYRREFAKYPGTYYISAGWVKEKVQPKSSDATSSPENGCSCTDPEYLKLVEKHGAENADAIQYFLSSWQRNYQRAAFIDTGAPQHQRYARIAQDMASRYGWKYESLEGSGELLAKMLRCSASSAEVLLVPPHHVTVYEPVVRGLEAVPVWKAGETEGRDEVIEIGGQADPHERHSRLGLGIDAGGTYTDVVLYEFATDRVIQKAKALTTKWDYTVGISEALDQLDPAGLKSVDLVAVSTTLATNAVVEGRGQKVGLLIMPPYGLFHEEDIAHRPIAVVQGRLDIDGTELAPVNAEEIREVARRMIQQEQIRAFAVTGYASCANPAHELEIQRILREETDLPVTCGHEVSAQLGYAVRAQTAALNGRIIPFLVSFLRQAAECLRQRGVDAPLMVVRSDGSLMSAQTAHRRPVETLLSGPAASVAGARFLAKAPTAFVVDVGGTTTDTAMIINGAVRTTTEGARVGGWQTHVQTLDMRTTGLGGDSLIGWDKQALTIGPRRVSPVAWLGKKDPAGLDACFAWIEKELEKDAPPPAQLLDLYVLNGHPTDTSLSTREQRIVAALAQRPHSLCELAVKVQDHWWEVIDLDRLEHLQIVQRSGLTPTDILHVTGQFTRWSAEASRRAMGTFARIWNMDEDALPARINELFTRRLATEVLKKQLDATRQTDGGEDDIAAATLVENWLAGGDGDMRVRISLKHPIIGIGAPVGHFLPAAAALLETEAIVPEHADVANAIGAITSCVTISRRVEICPDVNGHFCLRGVEGSPSFADLTQARKAAMESLKQSVTSAALESGTSSAKVQFTIHDNIAPMADGGQVFVSEIVEARVSGRPDLRRLATA